MRKRVLPVSLLLFMVFVISAIAGEVEYDRYVNVRFSYGISYPKGILMPQGEVNNGDGQKLLSKDGKVLMLAYGYNNGPEYTLRNVYRDEISGSNRDNPNRIVKYKILKNNWFVVSGTDGDNIFYTKVIYKAEDDQFINFKITYPKSQRGFYDSIVSAISNSMKILPGPVREEQVKKVK